VQVAYYVQLNAINEIVTLSFMTEDNIDVDREMVFKFPMWRQDANNDTIDILKYLSYMECDGSGALTLVWDAVADTLPACVQNKMCYKEFTVTTSLIPNNSMVWLYFKMNEARAVDVYPVALRYYQKRRISS